MVTIKGVGPDAYDRKVDSQPATPGMPTLSDDRYRPVGLMQTIIGVGWGTGRLLFAGGGGALTPVPLVLTGILGGGGPINVGAGVSTTGIRQFHPKIFTTGGGNELVKDPLNMGDTELGPDAAAGDQGGGLAYVGIHGKLGQQDIFVIGGFRIESATQDSNNSQTIVEIPVIFHSNDFGKTWSTGSCPTLPTSDGTLSVIPTDPPTEIYSTTNGSVTALAFDPKLQTFYATVSYVSDLGGTSQAFCSSKTGVDFAGSFTAVAGQGAAVTTFPLPDWPDGAHVNDANISYSNERSHLQISDKVKYVAVNGPGQTMKIGGSGPKGKGLLKMTGTPTNARFAGVNVPAGLGGGNGGQNLSGCAKGGMVFLTDGGQLFISLDQGNTFKPFAAELGSSDPNNDIRVGNFSFS
jgi:hypothetical protein